MKLNQKILKAINEGIRKSLLSFDDVQFDKSSSNISNKNTSTSIKNWQYIQDNFVDLGLPSGTLWCKYNLGATNENTPKSWYGHYYMWGSIKPNDNDYCDWKNAPFNNGKEDFDRDFSNHMYEFVDQTHNLLLEYDVVYQTDNLMHMPTKEQVKELEKLPNKWVKNHNGINGLNGRVFTGNNGNELFIPAAGWHNGSYYVYQGDRCRLWTSRLSTDYSVEQAWYFYFYSDDIGLCTTDRYCGFPVRGIINKEDIS